MEQAKQLRHECDGNEVKQECMECWGFISVRNTVPSAALERVHRSVIKRPAYLLTQPCFFFSAITERPEFL